MLVSHSLMKVLSTFHQAEGLGLNSLAVDIYW